jgi:hypothetical protein
MSEEMIEKVARAIWDAQYESGTSWDDWADHVAKGHSEFDGRDTSRKLARAALSAYNPNERLREALEACKAYFETLEEIGGEKHPAMLKMIDEALPQRKNNMDSTDALTRDLIPFLGNIAQMLDEMKVERGNHPTIEWTAYNQEQRDILTTFLRRACALSALSPLPQGE